MPPRQFSPSRIWRRGLAELVEQFDRHRADYLRPDYSELKLA